MAINGSINPNVLHEHSAAILRRYGAVTYARCWIDVMILHRQSELLACVFASLTPPAEGSARPEVGAHVHAHP